MRAITIIFCTFIAFATQLSANTSASNRGTKTVSLVYNASSFIPLPASGGYSLGYFLNSDKVIELSSDTISLSVPTDSISVETALTVTSARLKWFLGNSFYLNLGLGQRKLSAVVSPFEMESNATGVQIAFGNCWQWSWLSLGFDWVGFFQPIAYSSTSNIPVVPGDSSSDAVVKTLDTFGKIGAVTFTLFYLGVSF
ncbi:MAG: hypothetical protein CMP10_18260 [Zetaproteobacteria bacterium]|nr:hypothetical protein [Pseudobdellovibrionaceae bacterium]